MRRFEGNVVWVTGGNRNTGLDLVERFSRDGAKVYMCGASAASTAKGADANMTGKIVTCDAGCSCQHMPEDVDV